jgi:hypothetical protein
MINDIYEHFEFRANEEKKIITLSGPDDICFFVTEIG